MDFLTDFKTTKIPLNYLFYQIGRLPYREYSISKLNETQKSSEFIPQLNNVTQFNKIKIFKKFNFSD